MVVWHVWFTVITLVPRLGPRNLRVVIDHKSQATMQYLLHILLWLSRTNFYLIYHHTQSVLLAKMPAHKSKCYNSYTTSCYTKYIYGKLKVMLCTRPVSHTGGHHLGPFHNTLIGNIAGKLIYIWDIRFTYTSWTCPTYLLQVLHRRQVGGTLQSTPVQRLQYQQWLQGTTR